MTKEIPGKRKRGSPKTRIYNYRRLRTTGQARDEAEKLGCTIVCEATRPTWVSYSSASSAHLLVRLVRAVQLGEEQRDLAVLFAALTRLPHRVQPAVRDDVPTGLVVARRQAPAPGRAGPAVTRRPVRHRRRRLDRGAARHRGPGRRCLHVDEPGVREEGVGVVVVRGVVGGGAASSRPVVVFRLVVGARLSAAWRLTRSLTIYNRETRRNRIVINNSIFPVRQRLILYQSIKSREKKKWKM